MAVCSSGTSRGRPRSSWASSTMRSLRQGIRAGQRAHQWVWCRFLRGAHRPAPPSSTRQPPTQEGWHMLWTTVRFPRAGLVPSKKGCQIFETDGTRAPGAAEKYGTGFLWRWDSPEKRPGGAPGRSPRAVSCVLFHKRLGNDGWDPRLGQGVTRKSGIADGGTGAGRRLKARWGPCACGAGSPAACGRDAGG